MSVSAGKRLYQRAQIERVLDSASESSPQILVAGYSSAPGFRCPVGALCAFALE